MKNNLYHFLFTAQRTNEWMAIHYAQRILIELKKYNVWSLQDLKTSFSTNTHTKADSVESMQSS